MKISKINSTNFKGIRLINPSFEHSKYIANLLKAENIYVSGHKTYYMVSDFNSKKNIINFIRTKNNFSNNECGIVFFPLSMESWIVSNKSFEQKIKKILDDFYINSEINLGI